LREEGSRWQETVDTEREVHVTFGSRMERPKEQEAAEG